MIGVPAAAAISIPFELPPSKRRITVPSAGHTSEIDAGAVAGALSAGAGAGRGVADALAPLRSAPLVDAAPAGGATRSTWPTSMLSGLVRLFQRTMLCTDCRLLRAICDSVSPRSTR